MLHYGYTPYTNAYPVLKYTQQRIHNNKNLWYYDNSGNIIQVENIHLNHHRCIHQGVELLLSGINIKHRLGFVCSRLNIIHLDENIQLNRSQHLHQLRLDNQVSHRRLK